MPQPIIEVRNLSKRYRLGGVGARSLRDELERVWHRFRGSKRQGDPGEAAGAESSSREFWALRDVSFEVQPGEVLGIIGRNGAGKSTLLKILSRITEPTAGEVVLRGRIASLLEVGTGFHPELTGRENIFLNGAILGMKRWEIQNKLDEIVAFSGVGPFLDTPVKRYSSGMYVRLAFAIAAHLEPEILILDEVLAVGDADFQKRCLDKMRDVSMREGCTILFVSHQLSSVSALCSRGVIMEKGSLARAGNIQDIVDHYLSQNQPLNADGVWRAPEGRECGAVGLASVRILVEGKPTGSVTLSSAVQIEITYETVRPETVINASIHLLDSAGTCILATANFKSATLEPDPLGGAKHPSGIFVSRCEIPAFFLNEGTYRISAFVVSNYSGIEDQAPECLTFTAHDDGHMRSEYLGHWIGQIRPKMKWQTEQVSAGAAE